jgi:hypothetical protein
MSAIRNANSSASEPPSGSTQNMVHPGRLHHQWWRAPNHRSIEVDFSGCKSAGVHLRSFEDAVEIQDSAAQVEVAPTAKPL